ncbi:hypothetical protein QQF64_028888 [Cirrhinus molitorella]|uniref:Uncharacterized protein n=1 Tax=Cirrhinus molitorella TaxID=172907 RepID=A0ABR3N7V7_9TELE
MANASSASEGVKGKDTPRPCACGAMISAKDSHPLCIACLGVRHAQAALANPECCPHCSPFPSRVLERRVRVAAAILPSTPSQPGNVLSEGSPASAQVELDLLEMCRRAAAKLSIDWPSQQGTERDLYDGKRLPRLLNRSFLRSLRAFQK